MLLTKALLGTGDRIVAAVDGDGLRPLDLTQVDSVRRLCDVLHHADPLGLARFLVDTRSAAIPLSEAKLLAPVDRQEIWAAGCRSGAVVGGGLLGLEAGEKGYAGERASCAVGIAADAS